jgi:hypothetical protein
LLAFEKVKYAFSENHLVAWSSINTPKKSVVNPNVLEALLSLETILAAVM